jgi:hypothetical protein
MNVSPQKQKSVHSILFVLLDLLDDHVWIEQQILIKIIIKDNLKNNEIAWKLAEHYE